MTIKVSILDNQDAYDTEKVLNGPTGTNRAPFQISETVGSQKLIITRMQFIDGMPKREEILSVSLKTGKVTIHNLDDGDKVVVNAALEKAAEKITDVESPYIGVFNDK